MAKPPAQGKATKSAIEWAHDRAQDPAHRDEVEALLAEINLRQDLIAFREARGLTQVQLAERMGVTQPVIAKIEGGHTTDVKVGTLAKIAAALGARLKISFEVRGEKKATRKKRAAA